MNDRRCDDEYSRYNKKQRKESRFWDGIEEACRQWCCCIDEVPERKDGEGFSDFFYEIFEDKEKEYVQQVRELNGGRLPIFSKTDKNYER